MDKPLVLYHANCWDGFGAAWVARKALGDIEAVPVQYGQDPPDVTGREVYILDFSYKRSVMIVLWQQARRLVCLDHHKTAAEELADLYPTGGGDDGLIRFDMNKSGGRLAWEYFFTPGRASPWLVDYTEDRDLWRWKLPCSREVNAALRSYDLDFKVWDCLVQADPRVNPELPREGSAILRREQQIIDEHIAHAREVEMDGHKILAVNATVLFSDIAGELAKGRPFGACWFERPDGKRQWSLRSAPDGVDVSEIAKQRGGGGHKHAAGFEE
jgi:oligoribonuclease NrnB/cAMP/cGMP phosphodiesterase (DHH superfamily)